MSRVAETIESKIRRCPRWRSRRRLARFRPVPSSSLSDGSSTREDRRSNSELGSKKPQRLTNSATVAPGNDSFFAAAESAHSIGSSFMPTLLFPLDDHHHASVSEECSHCLGGPEASCSCRSSETRMPPCP